MLLAFFTEFLAVLNERTIVTPVALGPEQTPGALCAVALDVTFHGSAFCFTAASAKYKRVEFEALVSALGASHTGTSPAKLYYLVLGAKGNPCLAFACYGRKVEKAVELRKKGRGRGDLP